MEAKNTIHINKALNRNKVEIIVPLVRGKSKVIEVLDDIIDTLDKKGCTLCVNLL